MKRIVLSMGVAALLAIGCETNKSASAPETASLEPAETVAAPEDVQGGAPEGAQDGGHEPTCFDSEAARVKCQDGQVFSHAGCAGDDLMKRCASCSDIAATLCGPGTRFVHVPECPHNNQGDCVPFKD